MSKELKQRADMINILVNIIYDNCPEGLETAISKMYVAYYLRIENPEFQYESFKNRIVCGLAAKMYNQLTEASTNISHVANTFEESWM